jgi:predicted nucleic acid-binding protein
VTLAVVDASVALKLFVAEEGSDKAEALHRDFDLIAPDLVIPETLNALWKAHRRGLVGKEHALQIVPAIAKPYFALFAADELAESAWNIAVSLDHPAYDGFYVALAEMQHCTLFTADERLWRKTRRTRFASLVKQLQRRP